MDKTESVLLAAGGVIGVCGLAAVVLHEQRKQETERENATKATVLDVLSGKTPAPKQATPTGLPGAWVPSANKIDTPIVFSPKHEFSATLKLELGRIRVKGGKFEDAPTVKTVNAALRGLVRWVYLFVWSDPAKVPSSLPMLQRAQELDHDASGDVVTRMWIFGLPAEAGKGTGLTGLRLPVSTGGLAAGFRFVETWQRPAPIYPADAV
jgi:hypothetical protein